MTCFLVWLSLIILFKHILNPHTWFISSSTCKLIKSISETLCSLVCFIHVRVHHWCIHHHVCKFTWTWIINASSIWVYPILILFWSICEKVSDIWVPFTRMKLIHIHFFFNMVVSQKSSHGKEVANQRRDLNHLIDVFLKLKLESIRWNSVAVQLVSILPFVW